MKERHLLYRKGAKVVNVGTYQYQRLLRSSIALDNGIDRLGASVESYRGCGAE